MAVRGMMSDFSSGLRYVSSSMGFLRRNGMFYVYAIIFVAVCVTFSVGVAMSVRFGEYCSDWVMGMFAVSGWSDWAQTAMSWVSYFVSLLVRLLSFLLTIAFSGYLSLLILSPLFTFIATRCLTILTGKTVPFRLGAFLYSLWRSLVIIVRNFVLQTICVLLLFLLGFVPVAGLLAPLLAFFVQSFYIGFSLADYAVDVDEMGVVDSVRYINSRKGAVAGIGCPYALLMYVPVIGVYLALFLAPLCVVASCRMLCSDKYGISS